MTMEESKALKKGTRVYWRGDAADSGTITETSWDAVTIAWNSGQVARVHHGDMRDIQHTSAKPYTCVTALCSRWPALPMRRSAAETIEPAPRLAR
jgi:hypothetical protein